MFAIRIELLTGVYYASAFDDRSAAEWPPHPGRLYSAMTAAWATGGNTANERDALEWLERQPPPTLTCSPDERVGHRAVLTHFVPVNDPSGLATLPSERGLQPRTYPAAIPESPVVFFVWPESSPSDAVTQSLAAMLDRVWRLGHSSSFVACTVEDDPLPDPTFVPNDNGRHRVRVPTDDLLAALELAHASHQGSEPRVLPNWTVRYDRPGLSVPQGLYGDMISLRLNGRSRLPIADSLSWCRSLRSALNSYASQSNDFVAGHEPGSLRPRTAPHPCFIPLVHCDSTHADGLIHGFGVVLPVEATAEERLAIEDSLDAWAATLGGMRLYTKGGREVLLERVPFDDQRQVFRSERWARSAREWASATPIVLDRFPDHLGSSDPDKHQRGLAETRAIIVRSLADQGLPEPSSITISTNAAMVSGSSAARSFAKYRRGRQGPVLLKVHSRLHFSEKVAGPLIIGAGRHLGYGLMVPGRAR